MSVVYLRILFACFLFLRASLELVSRPLFGIPMNMEHVNKYCGRVIIDLMENSKNTEYLASLEGKGDREIAYFTMEVGLNENIPTYGGGLGVLAGDSVKSCADLRVPLVCITLLNEKGYFYQRIDGEGNQIEEIVHWNPEDYLTILPERVDVEIEGRKVRVQAWLHDIAGNSGYHVPVLFLDTNLSENTDEDRRITWRLYPGDPRVRLMQEIVLGIGGVRVIQKIGFSKIEKYHMNEGHSSLLVLELLRQSEKDGQYDFDGVRDKCVFTTHTPVAAAYDKYSLDLVEKTLGNFLPMKILKEKCLYEDQLNMTYLALKNSKYINGVAKKHGEVSRALFPGFMIDSITNGVHSNSWASEHFTILFDRYIPGWIHNPFSLRNALSIPKDEVWDAHHTAKKKLISFVNKFENIGMDNHIFTIGFARRSTAYKRPDLILRDKERLLNISQNTGEIQLIFAGKAHPQDGMGKDLIRKIHSIKKELEGRIKIAYLENYDISTARLLTSGVDLWLNNPRRPLEASGTSGMKACFNGVPNLSVLDGWWLEGHIENVTGWSIGPREGYESKDHNVVDDLDSKDLYDKLEKIIIPMYYNDRDRWIDVMKHAIAFNASFFNTHRMVQEYVMNAYFR